MIWDRIPAMVLRVNRVLAATLPSRSYFTLFTTSVRRSPYCNSSCTIMLPAFMSSCFSSVFCTPRVTT